MESPFIAAVLSTIILAVNGDHYYVVESNGSPCPPCGHNEQPVNLSTVIGQPSTYLTSDTILTFLPGTHILDYSGPIVISDVNDLTLQGNGSIEDGFHWTVKQSDVIIKCRDSVGGGFVFNRSSITIMGVTITNCGTSDYNGFLYEALKPYTNGLYSNSFNTTVYSAVGATLLFIECHEVYLGSYLSVQNCSGNCLTFFNSYNVNMSHVYLAHNSPEQYAAMECCDATPTNRPVCVGGNAFFYYLDSPQCDMNFSMNFNLTIQDSVFAFAAGSGKVGTSMAGITIFNLLQAMLNINMESVLLYNNAGGNFGAISSYSYSYFNNITSSMANRYYVHYCPNDIGFSFKFSITNEILCPAKKQRNFGYTAAKVIVANSLFEENIAINSAGINIDSTFVLDFLDVEGVLNFTVENCTIRRNHAPIASCLGCGGFISYPAIVYVKLRNLLMIDNFIQTSSNVDYVGIPGSCIAAVFTTLMQLENIIVANQSLTGLFGLSSGLRFSGNNIFQNNTSVSLGGGILLGSGSKFVLESGTNVTFIDNRAALGAGIGIFSSQVVPLIYQLCTIQIVDHNVPNVTQSYMIFRGNRATITGNIIYGGFLDNCLIVTGNEVVPIRDSLSEIFIIEDADPAVERYQFSSDSLKLCFCNEMNKVNCSIKEYTTNPVYPGQSVEVSIVNTGDLGGLTTGPILIRAHFLNYTYTQSVSIEQPACTIQTLYIAIQHQSLGFISPFTSADNYSITFVMSQDPFRSIVDPVSVYINVTVMDCPIGFVVNESFICHCDPFLSDRFDIFCDISNNSMTHSSNIWVGYDNLVNSIIYSAFCPFDYCVHELVSFNILEPDAQCAYNRSGILCGGCAEGYSLLLGSNECGECPNDNYLSLLLVFGIAGILLVVLLILLNLTVSVGTINGLIFYANFVQIGQSRFFPDGPIPVLSNFIAFLNLDFGFKTCFYKGMTPYAKVWLQYAFPLYLWLLIALIIIVCKYSVKLSHLVGSNAVPVLATLLILSFTKLIRVSLMTLGVSRIRYQDGAVKVVWRIDGNLQYSGTEHFFLMISGHLVLCFVVLPMIVFVTLIPFRQRIISSVGFFRYLHTKFTARYPGFALRIKPLSDAFSGPFQDSKGFWLGVGLVIRFIIAGSVPFCSEHIGLFIMFTCILLNLSLFAVLKGPYKYHIVNVLEVWVLLNLLVVIFFGFQGNVTYVVSTTKISVSLMLVAFVFIAVGHVVWQIKKHPSVSQRLTHFESTKGSVQLEEYVESSLTHYREPLLDD